MSIPQKTIAIDLDGVCVNYNAGLQRWLAKNVDTRFSDLSCPTQYDFMCEGWEDVHDNFTKYHTAAVEDGLYRDLPILDGCSDTLWELHHNNWLIHVVTSRFISKNQVAIVCSDTCYNLDKHNIPVDSISFTSHKTDVLADLYLDDAPTNILQLHNANRNIVVFDQPYNRDIDYVPRVHNWEEVCEFASQIS